MSDSDRHRIQRIRRETRRRSVMVTSVEQLMPRMLRVWFAGDDLADFESAAPDDHVKLFVPDGNEMAKRDYTPRLFDPVAQTLAIDFALHDDSCDIGPATRWAAAAQPGDVLEIGGPRGSTVVPDDFDWYLMIGDETAIPSFARRLEELRLDASVFVVTLTDGPRGRMLFPAHGRTTVCWAERGGDDAGALLNVVRTLTLPPGDGFVWIAAEASVARAVREHVLDERGLPRNWVKASGYWSAGESATHTKLNDD